MKSFFKSPKEPLPHILRTIRPGFAKAYETIKKEGRLNILKKKGID